VPIAKAMVSTSLVTPAELAVYHHPRMLGFNRGSD
jgi:hypothetical protein